MPNECRCHGDQERALDCLGVTGCHETPEIGAVN